MEGLCRKNSIRQRVAICGLGGLGSNIAIALARAGVGRLILTDFDRVDITNLHRQQYKATQLGEFKTEALAANLREIAPYLTIETHTTAITEENFEEILAPADVICEAFDNAEAKAMLVNGVLEKLHTKYLIAASGMAGSALQTASKPEGLQTVFISAETESAMLQMTLAWYPLV